MQTIDLAMAKQMIDDIIAERGEGYIYPHLHCEYAHPAGGAKRSRAGDMVTIKSDEPGCGIGLALIQRGVVTTGWFLEGSYNVSPLFELEDPLEGLGWKFTTEAFKFLAYFQNEQDGGVPWGKARAYALTHITKE